MDILAYSIGVILFIMGPSVIEYISACRNQKNEEDYEESVKWMKQSQGK